MSDAEHPDVVLYSQGEPLTNDQRAEVRPLWTFFGGEKSGSFPIRLNSGDFVLLRLPPHVQRQLNLTRDICNCGVADPIEYIVATYRGSLGTDTPVLYILDL
jgi:hypothetical protein